MILGTLTEEICSSSLPAPGNAATAQDALARQWTLFSILEDSLALRQDGLTKGGGNDPQDSHRTQHARRKSLPSSEVDLGRCLSLELNTLLPLQAL